MAERNYEEALRRLLKHEGDYTRPGRADSASMPDPSTGSIGVSLANGSIGGDWSHIAGYETSLTGGLVAGPHLDVL